MWQDLSEGFGAHQSAMCPATCECVPRSAAGISPPLTNAAARIPPSPAQSTQSHLSNAWLNRFEWHNAQLECLEPRNGQFEPLSVPPLSAE